MAGSLSFNFEVNTDNATRVFRNLRDLIEPRSLLTAVGFRQLEFIQENFDQDGRLIESPSGWKRLSPNTIAARRQGGGVGSPKILRDTGMMRNSLDVKGVDVQGNRVEVGFTDQKAKWHHEGVRGHEIRPVNGRALSFVMAHGRVIVKRVVWWPGIPSRKLIPGKRMAEQISQEAIDNLLSGFDAT